MTSSRGSSQPRNQTQVSCIAGGFFTFWATKEVQEHWSRQPIPSPGALPNPGVELGSPTLQADSWPAELPGKPLRKILEGVYAPWKRVKGERKSTELGRQVIQQQSPCEGKGWTQISSSAYRVTVQTEGKNETQVNRGIWIQSKKT